MWPTRRLCALLIIARVSCGTAAEAADLVHLGGQYFAAGQEVYVTAKGRDDIFAAGGDVIFDGAAGDHLFGAGGHVTYRGVEAQDAVAAGGAVELAGVIADDVMLAGGRIRVMREASIGDSAILAGNDVVIDGRIGGAAWVAAETVLVAGAVVGDLNVQAGRLVIASGASIGGDVTYRSPREATIASDARIGGEVRFVQGEPRHAEWRGGATAGMAIAMTVLAMTLLAAALQAAVPRLLATAAATVAERPWVSLGLGFATLVATPVAFVLLLASLVGAPLGLVVLFAYLMAPMPAIVVFAYWLGVGIWRRLGRQAQARHWGGRLGWTVLGLVVLALIGLLPWVGGAALFIALLFGLGGLVSGTARHLRRPVDTLPPG